MNLFCLSINKYKYINKKSGKCIFSEGVWPSRNSGKWGMGIVKKEKEKIRNNE